MSAVLDDPSSIGSGAVLLLGSGAIGSAIADALRRHGRARTRSAPIPWTSSDRGDALRGAMDLLPVGAHNAVVWAAGRAGFSAVESTCEQELDAFIDVMRAIGHMVDQPGSRSLSLHVVSSAGALFEGVTRVSAASTTSPLRPYGHLKAEQERRSGAAAGSIPVTIYRASTVYGTPSRGHRPGLIATLVQNGLGRRPTSLYGALDTLRDYVSADEIGQHIARRVGKQSGAGLQVEMLVAGRPTPIAAVIDIVERALRRRLLTSYVDAWNARDITFDPSIRAIGFKPEPLTTGVARVVAQSLGRP